MFSFSSSATYDSALFPGVRFTVKVATAGNRDALMLSIAKHQQAFDDAMAKLAALRDDSPVHQGEFATVALQRARQLIRSEYVAWGLLSIEGLVLNGNHTPTVAEVIEHGPTELFGEIHARIEENLGLSREQSGNSPSPTTSSTPGVGEIQTTSAVPVLDQAVS